MTSLNSCKPLDNSSGIGQDSLNKAMNANEQSKKLPWFLRFATGSVLRKSGLIAVLAIAALLTPTLIEQLEAASASTNRITRSTPLSYRSKSPTSSTNRVIPRRSIAPPSRRTTPSTNQVRQIPNRNRVVPPRTPSRTTPPPRPTTPATSTPSAVPAPVLLVAKPILKRGAILAGKWLIAVLAEYGVHTAIDRVFQNNKDQEANAIVHGARWLSNEYFWRSSNPNIPSPRNVLTTIATMGDENEPASAEGWNAISNRSMTQSEAKGYLKRRIASTTVSTWSAKVPATPTKHAQTMFFPIKARTDYYAAEEARMLALYRAMHPTITFTKCGEDLKKWKVGSFGMVSKFKDPAPILQELGKSNAIDSEANYYEATATWEYRNLLPNGEWREWEEAEKTFQGDRDNGGDGIKSWETHHFDFDFCDDNQEITDPEIYRGIKRFITKRPVYERQRASGQMSRGGKYRWVRVGWEPVVAQKYHDDDN